MKNLPTHLFDVYTILNHSSFGEWKVQLYRTARAKSWNFSTLSFYQVYRALRAPAVWMLSFILISVTFESARLAHRTARAIGVNRPLHLVCVIIWLIGADFNRFIGYTSHIYMKID